MTITAKQTYSKAKSSVRNVAVSFEEQLESGESLTGTPVVTEVTSLSLALSNKQVNSSTTRVKVYDVPAGKAVLFTVSGGLVGNAQVRVSCGTDAAQPQTVVLLVNLTIEDDGT